MSRKNNRAKIQRHNAHAAKEEKERMEKNKRKNETRLKNQALKAQGIAPVDP